MLSLLKKGGKRSFKKGGSKVATNSAGSFGNLLKRNSGSLKKRLRKGGSNLADSARKNSDKLAKKAKKGGSELAQRAKKGGDIAAGKIKKTTKSVAGAAAGKSKTALKAAGAACYSNPKKCAAVTAGVALAGYTAYKFQENSKEQQICITNCLPEEWGQFQYGNVSGVTYFEESEVINEEGEVQPQCTSGDCETFCKTKCEELHPTTVLGAAKEAITDVMDKALVPFLEDFIGLPVTSMSKQIFMFFRIALALIVLMIAYRIYSAVRAVFGLTKTVVQTAVNRCEEVMFVM